MSIKIKTSWVDSNAIIEGLRIYKSLEEFDAAGRPEPLVEILDGADFYEDFDVVEDQTYFYMLSCFLGDQEVFTECYAVNTTLAPPDPYFTNVKLLMQFDGASPLVDPASGATWTLNGDAFIDTSDKMFSMGGALHVSDNISSYARSPVLTNMHTPNVSNKAITVEFFFKKTSAIGNAGAVCFQNADNLNDRYAFFMRSGAGNFNVSVYTTSASTFIDTTTDLNLNEWVHFAYVELESGISKLYINGIEKYSVYAGRPINFWARTIATLGQSGIDAEPYGGLIDGLRVSDIARYTTNFTPPERPLPSR